MTSLGPRALVIGVLALLFFFSTTSIAQTAVVPPSTESISTFFQSGWFLPDPPPPVKSDPLWDRDGWNNGKPKKPPVGVPEGGSTSMYLGLTGFACLLAIGFGRRRKSQQPLLARTSTIS